MVFLCGICLLPEKMTIFFSILNKHLSIAIRYLQVFCRIIEYPAKCTSFNFIYCTRMAGSLENTPVLISGKIIWGKTVSCKNNLFLVNQCPHYGEVAQKNTFFTEHLPVAASGYCVSFLLELKRVDVCLKKKKIFRESKKTLIILYRPRTSYS